MFHRLQVEAAVSLSYRIGVLNALFCLEVAVFIKPSPSKQWS
jgi:hypothetical protein